MGKVRVNGEGYARKQCCFRICIADDRPEAGLLYIRRSVTLRRTAAAFALYLHVTANRDDRQATANEA